MKILIHIAAASYVDRRQVDTPRGFPGTNPSNIPSANKVSSAVFKAKQENKGNADFLSTLFMAAGQFLDHDIGLSPRGKTCDIE